MGHREVSAFVVPKSGMYPIFLQKKMDVLISYITKIFKARLAWGYIPSAWQKAKVIYLTKVYRVIELTPKLHRSKKLSVFLLKTLELLLETYLRSKILKKEPLINSQYASQPRKSTDSALVSLITHISKSIAFN